MKSLGKALFYENFWKAGIELQHRPVVNLRTEGHVKEGKIFAGLQELSQRCWTHHSCSCLRKQSIKKSANNEFLCF